MKSQAKAQVSHQLIWMKIGFISLFMIGALFTLTVKAEDKGVGRVYAIFKDASGNELEKRRCMGTVVGSHHVLTAASCVYDADLNGFAKRFYFKPNINTGYYAARVFVPKQWSTNGNTTPANDFSVVIFKSSDNLSQHQKFDMFGRNGYTGNYPDVFNPSDFIDPQTLRGVTVSLKRMYYNTGDPEYTPRKYDRPIFRITTEDFRMEGMTEQVVGAYVGAPLFFKNKLIGVLAGVKAINTVAFEMHGAVVADTYGETQRLIKSWITRYPNGYEPTSVR